MENQVIECKVFKIKIIFDMSGRIFVRYDEIEELISKYRLQNDIRPNTKDTRPMREGLRLLNSNHLTKFGILTEISDEISVIGYCVTNNEYSVSNFFSNFQNMTPFYT